MDVWMDGCACVCLFLFVLFRLKFVEMLKLRVFACQ